jgi:hypothetical protein
MPLVYQSLAKPGSGLDYTPNNCGNRDECQQGNQPRALRGIRLKVPIYEQCEEHSGDE